MTTRSPIVKTHCGVLVVRDDLYRGGTKARYVAELFDDVATVVYASPCEGGAQTALASVAKHLGKRAVIVCSQRRVRHPRTIAAAALGAEIVEVPGMSMLNVVQARARDWAHDHGARLAPFGLDIPSAVPTIAAAAAATRVEPDEVWCAASSGVLARGLANCWPKASLHVVQVGHKVNRATVAGATIHVFNERGQLREACPNEDFPSDPHYDAKAWAICKREHGPGAVLFWNVTGAP
jgi:hypothetical protein